MIIAPVSSFNDNPFYVKDGQVCWNHMPGDRYVVTGIDRNNKRFKMTYDNWKMAYAINVWNGSKWLVRGGRRWLITRVRN